ncbi:MAG TPA: NUDIX domain-containing protein [Hyphomicrobiaceae bacterium]|nr:NUDIX domain-containing protein [Hyphomicrobiaceae bacterium]
MRDIQKFEVSLKAAIVDRGRLLLVQEADTGYWELPGGRIDVGEETLGHEAILAREIAEELGGDVRIAPRHEATSLIRQRPTDGQHIFLVIRLCRFVDGSIALSPEHRAYRWCAPDDWRTLNFPPLSDYARALNSAWSMV